MPAFASTCQTTSEFHSFTWKCVDAGLGAGVFLSALQPRDSSLEEDGSEIGRAASLLPKRGLRTAKTTVPFNALAGKNDENEIVVRRARESSNRIFDGLLEIRDLIQSVEEAGSTEGTPGKTTLAGREK
ncbi:hypothetical protein [Tranquillimonas alkanivorans]|uniref:hypothetical protein n=1 Tax=Tranquillimonas alkanivorans TaxID=441119 RepID=UPI0015A6EA7A|nr:hypothetical protein [Tranquillimonas alkanivorans]